MQIPYVIDNQTHRLADILNALLAEYKGQSLDIATAYFTIGGFGLLQEGLRGLGNFRLLLGDEPTSGEQLGLRPNAGNTTRLIQKDLEALPFSEKTFRLVEDLIAHLRRETVLVRLHDKGFLHAKCWLFYADRPGQQLLFDRFRPILAIVGSSNFTTPGLTSNRELNLAHKVLLDPAEVEDRDAAYAVSWLSDTKPSGRMHWRTANCSKVKWEPAPLSIWKAGTKDNGPTHETSKKNSLNSSTPPSLVARNIPPTRST